MEDLSVYGFTAFRLAGFDAGEGRVVARVTSVHKDRFGVVSASGHGFARLRRVAFEGGESRPTVGDFVALFPNALGDGRIDSVFARASSFGRREPGPIPREQAIAANFDFVCVLTSLNLEFRMNRLERYLSVALKSGGEPIIVLTKSDLAAEGDHTARSVADRFAGIRIVSLSAKTGEGVGEFCDSIPKGSTLAFLGSSGVGKSSLLNALAGEELMAVREISEEGARGGHTTTHRELIALPCGFCVVDTPGMREMGLWGVEEGVELAFDGFGELVSMCRFADCTHGSEPGCAVREAIERGDIDEDAIRRYAALKREARREKRLAAIKEHARRAGAIHVKKLARRIPPSSDESDG